MLLSVWLKGELGGAQNYLTNTPVNGKKMEATTQCFPLSTSKVFWGWNSTHPEEAFATPCHFYIHFLLPLLQPWSATERHHNTSYLLWKFLRNSTAIHGYTRLSSDEQCQSQGTSLGREWPGPGYSPGQLQLCVPVLHPQLHDCSLPVYCQYRETCLLGSLTSSQLVYDIKSKSLELET